MKNSGKLNLNDLKVSSFVTSLDSKDAQAVKGGMVQAIALGVIAVAFAVAFVVEVNNLYKK